MIEIPEAATLACQINDTISGRCIVNVIAGSHPHKFAWYHGDPGDYAALLTGKTIHKAESVGSMVKLIAGTTVLVFADGVRLRYHTAGDKLPKKHQMLVEFDNGSVLSASVQMYGGLWCFEAGSFDNPYYQVAQQKPSPLTDRFNEEYFNDLISAEEVQSLSAKAFLATEQRIPGLGNGVLQDILYNTGVHPKRRISTLDQKERQTLFQSVKNTLKEMTQKGGRDTEKDLFGQPGGYITKMSRNTLHQSCPRCGGTVMKANYLGGSIYYCEGCQPL